MYTEQGRWVWYSESAAATFCGGRRHSHKDLQPLELAPVLHSVPEQQTKTLRSTTKCFCLYQYANEC